MKDEEVINKLKLECEQLRFNTQRAGKEGPVTHRNAGDSGRVAALWIEKLQELNKKLENS